MRRDRLLSTLVLLAISIALDPSASADDRTCGASGFRALGYADGSNGVDARTSDACAPESRIDRDAYDAGWHAGHSLFLEESAIADLEDALSARGRELIRLDADLTAAQQRATRVDAPASERLDSLAKVQDLASTRRDLAAEIDGLELEIKSRKDDLAALRQSVADSD